MRTTRAEWGLVAALFLFALLATTLTANDYGPTYDEPHYISAGARYASWWTQVAGGNLDMLRPQSIDSVWRLNHEHPPLQKCASGLAQRWLSGLLPGLASSRMPSALWFALLLCAVYLYTRRVWGRRGAIFSALALGTMPRLVAHAHFVALDMPITAWFFITAALTATALQRNSWGWAALAGIAFGLALLSKMNAFFLPMLLLPWGLIWHRRRWPKLVLALCVVGPAVFWMGWPWLWLSPVEHFREYLSFHLGHAAYNIWYLGKLYQYAPWHYPFVLTAVTTPVAVLALAAGGMVRSWPRRGCDPARALLLLGLVVALAPSALPNSPKYNGVRLFLPAFPFLAALAGGGFAWLQLRLAKAAKCAGPGRMSALLAAGLGLALVLPSARAVVNTHPYQLAYYNALVGGPAGAAERGFETIYWGQVFQQAPQFLNAVPETAPLVLVIPRGCIYLLEFQQPEALRPDVRFTGDEGEAASVDYVMFQAMQSDYTDLCWALVETGEPVWALRLGETPLLLIYDREAVREVLEESGR